MDSNDNFQDTLSVHKEVTNEHHHFHYKKFLILFLVLVTVVLISFLSIKLLSFPNSGSFFSGNLPSEEMVEEDPVLSMIAEYGEKFPLKYSHGVKFYEVTEGTDDVIANFELWGTIYEVTDDNYLILEYPDKAENMRVKIADGFIFIPEDEFSTVPSEWYTDLEAFKEGLRVMKERNLHVIVKAVMLSDGEVVGREFELSNLPPEELVAPEVPESTDSFEIFETVDSL